MIIWTLGDYPGHSTALHEGLNGNWYALADERIHENDAGELLVAVWQPNTGAEGVLNITRGEVAITA